MFYRDVQALGGPLVLLCEAGPDTQNVRGPPVPIVRLRVACHSNDFKVDTYYARSRWNAGDVAIAIGSPLAALVVSLLRSNHPERDLDLFFEKEPLLNVLSMTKTLLEQGSLAAGRLAILEAIPLNDDGMPDYDRSFGCARRGQHSLSVDAAPLPLRLGQAIDATTTDVAVQMRRLASSLSDEEQKRLAAKLATTSALITLPGTFV